MTRSAPLILSAANMYLKLNELDNAQGMCDALREQQVLVPPLPLPIASLDLPRLACGAPPLGGAPPPSSPSHSGVASPTFLTVLVQGLSTEQKSMLAAKENDIVKARQAERGTKAMGGTRASAWQRKVDQAESAK